MAVETFRDFEHLTPHLSYEHIEQDASFAAPKNEGDRAYRPCCYTDGGGFGVSS